MGKRVFQRQHAAPGLPEQVHLAEAERLADGLHLGDEAFDAPKAEVLGPVRGAGAELVVDDDAVAVICQMTVAVADIVAGSSRPAGHAEQDLWPRPEAVSEDVVAIDGEPDGLVRLPV